MPEHEIIQSPLRVLIVEDVEDEALLLADFLESSGMTVEWERVDTEPALRTALGAGAWDVVLSDFSMPRFSGNQALRIVRGHDPEIPFIFVSGTIGEDMAVEAMKSGANDYVMKGNLMRLPPAIGRELREARLRRERHRAEQVLRKLSLVVKQAADSVFITDPSGRIEYVNPAFEALTGYSAEEATRSTPAILRSGLHDDRDYRELWDTIRKGDVFRGVMVNRRKDGELFHEDKVITPLKDDEGTITHFVSTGRDITARVRAEESRARLAAILEATPDLVAILDPGGGILYLNGAGRHLLGLTTPAGVQGRSLRDVFPEEIARQLISDVFPAVLRNGIWRGEATLHLSSGRELPVSQLVLAHRDVKGEPAFFSIIARDISERKRFESELHHRATHDSLTDLPNRFFLVEYFGMAIERAWSKGARVAVVCLDLDNFKRVNDSLGHDFGDLLLRLVARRLKTCLGPSDMLARHGGDEFVLMLDDMESVDDVLLVLNKLRVSFEHPVVLDGHEIYVTFSTGIAMYPSDGDRVEHLLRHADTAMHRAKSSGSSQYRFYEPEMNARGQEMLVLEADLRHALEHDEFRLYYQPQVEVASGRVVGMEGLIRWEHPERGLVSPDDFMPLVENSGLILKVGEWVIRQACRVLRLMEENGHPDLRISVNVSAAQFIHDNLLRTVRQILADDRVASGRLELEITENIVMQDPLGAADILRELHGMGVRTAIDDFGTGYSSLAYLKRFPLDVLKIDRSFVGDLEHDPNDAAIVEASISLARKLGLAVVAEGVENLGQLTFLRTRRCDLLQGYYLGKPMAEDEITGMLSRVWKW